MLRAILPPLIGSYAIFVAMVAYAHRRPAARPHVGSPWLGRRRSGLAQHLAITTLGGFLVFLSIVAVFHAWLAAERGVIRSALTEGAVLALMVFVAFAAAGYGPALVESMKGRIRRGRP
jgi:uncharacterized membrane protein (DUF485 family)